MRVIVLLVTGAALAAASAPGTAANPPRLAFSRGLDPGHYEIWTANATGGGLRRVTQSCGWDWWPSWSPDRTRIAFARACGGHFSIYVANVDGSGLHRLTQTSRGAAWPSWSPDGTRIAFASRGEIYTIGASAKGLQRLTRNTVDDATPAWSPDGSTILFASARGPGGSHRLTLIPAKGGSARVLPLRGGEPAWSPDGRRIAWARAVTGAAAETDELWVANADGSDEHRLLRERVGVASHHPTWSPDGRTIAFMSNRGAPKQGASLWSGGADGRHLERLTRAPFEDADPSW
jgi:Tol biopolymer transport system component